MFEFILIILIVVLLFHIEWRPKKLIVLAEQLKSEDKCLPIVGHAYVIKGANKGFMEALQRISRQAYRNKHGMVSVWFANKLFVSISDANAAAALLKTCLDKAYLTFFSKNLLGNGLVAAPVDIWRPHRKAALPMFGQIKLLGFLKIFEKEADILIDCVAETLGKGDFSAIKYLSLYAFDSVCESTIGVRVASQMQGHHPFLETVEKYFKLSVLRLCRPWLHLDILYQFSSLSVKQKECVDYIHKFIKDKVDEKTSEYHASDLQSAVEKPDKGYKTFLEMMLKIGVLSDLERREEVLVNIVAGSDTTSTALSFMFVLLSQYAGVQHQVYEEIKNIFGEDFNITNEKLKQLKYMDLFIMEVLRLYPPVPFVYRNCDKDISMPSGVTLYKGCHCLVNIWAIHRSRHHWGPDAETFNPDRFSNGALKVSTAYMPFNVTPRNCLGYQYAMMSIKTVLSKFLHRYRIIPASIMADDITKPLDVKFNVMLRHTKGFMIQVEERSS